MGPSLCKVFQSFYMLNVSKEVYVLRRLSEGFTCIKIKLLITLLNLKLLKRFYNIFCSFLIFNWLIHLYSYYTEHSLPCTEDVATCGDTCGKVLDCGAHTCTQRCHTGPCGTVCVNICVIMYLGQSSTFVSLYRSEVNICVLI